MTSRAFDVDGFGLVEETPNEPSGVLAKAAEIVDKERRPVLAGVITANE